MGEGSASRGTVSRSVKMSGTRTSRPTTSTCPANDAGTVQALRVLPFATQMLSSNISGLLSASAL
jgi:hypothetical protein